MSNLKRREELKVCKRKPREYTTNENMPSIKRRKTIGVTVSENTERLNKEENELKTLSANALKKRLTDSTGLKTKNKKASVLLTMLMTSKYSEQ